MSISDLILQAKSKKAQNILFVVGSVPQVRLQNEWTSFRDSPVLLSEWNILQQSVLSEQQKKNLEARGFLQGEGLFGGSRMGFSFYQNDETMKVLLDLELDAEMSGDANLPPIALETALRKKGMILLAGQNESSLTLAACELLKKMNAEKNFSALILSHKPFPRLREDRGIFMYSRFSEAVNHSDLSMGVEVAIFHACSDEESFLQALQWAERGMLVIYTMIAPSIFNAFRRCYGFLEKNFAKHGAPRFAEVVELALGQVSMRGLQQDTVNAYEVLLLKPQVRQLIAEEKLSELEELLKQAPDKSGLVNFNQAILQSLVRRRIDIKTAFESSRDPDGLDLLLKRVGI